MYIMEDSIFCMLTHIQNEFLLQQLITIVLIFYNELLCQFNNYRETEYSVWMCKKEDDQKKERLAERK